MSDPKNTAKSHLPHPWWRIFHVYHGREIMAVATPTILTMLSQTLMWTVDTALIGRVSVQALAAVGLGGMLTWTAYTLFNNLSRITGTFVSQAFGRNDDAAIGHYTWQGLFLGVGCGLLLQVLGYFSNLVLPLTHNPSDVQELAHVYIKWRSLSAVFTQITFVLMGFFQGRRDVRIPMYAGIVGNLVNLVLDIWLIFGWNGFELAGRTWLAMPALGVKGAALATSIGVAVNAIMLIYWALKPQDLRRRFGLTLLRRPDPRAIGNMVRIGLPAAWENFMDMAGFLAFTIFVGTIGAVQLAASHITVQLLSFSFMPLWGLTTAAGVFTGNWIGAGDTEKAAHFARQTYKLGTYYSLILATVLILLRSHVFRIFSYDPQVLALGATLTVLAAIFQYFDGIRMLSAGILQGAGDTRVPMLITLFVMWGAFIPVTWFLIVYRGGDVVSAWLGASACYLLLGFLLWRRFQSGKWKTVQIFR